MAKGLITIIFTTSLLHWSLTSDSWGGPLCSPYNENCKNNNDQDFLEEFGKRQMTEQNPAALANFQDVEEKKTRVTPFFHYNHAMPCFCHMENKLLDLGKSYYPRYIHSGTCNPDGCGGLYRCIDKHYRVHVLKQKQPNSETGSIMDLPQNIRDLWEVAIVRVTVGCECSP